MSISMTDQDNDGNLTNFSYDNCNNDSDSNIKMSRGLVYKGDTPFIKAFGYTPHYTIGCIPEDTKEYITTNFSNLRFYTSLEGTLLRLFYNDINNKWYLSTHKKLNARNSRWGSKYTFGEIFDSCIPDNFYDTLDKNMFYMFILTPNNDNRIVCKQFMNQLFHVGTYDNNFNLSYDYDIGIQKPLELKFENVDQMFKHVNTIGHFLYQGILICDIQTQSNTKIYSTNYDKFSKLRGNTPSINYRYLELRSDPDKVSNLKSMFCDHVHNFNKYEEYLNTFANMILNEYIKRYIKKKFVELDPQVHYILKLSHAWHNEDRDNNKINIDKVKEIINKQSAIFLNKIIKTYKQNSN